MAQNLFACPEHINRLQIEITTGCNLTCAGCQRTIFMEEKRWKNINMKLAQFERLITHAPRANAVILQGIGEPTLHNQLPEMIRFAKATGKFGVISFNTNALLHGADYYARLKELGLGHVSISVDSLDPQTAEKLRGGTDVALLRRAVREIGALFGNITLSIVLSRTNLPELPRLVGELYSLGGRFIEIQPLISYAASSDPNCLRKDDLNLALAFIQQANARYPGLTLMPAAGLQPNGNRCRRPFHAAYATVDGFLTPCCTTNDVDLFGRTSLVEMSWQDAWNAPGVVRWMEAFFSRDHEICHGCAFNSADGTQKLEPARKGVALQNAGKLEEARAHFTATLTNPDIAESLHRIGTLDVQAGRMKEALPALALAHRFAPDMRISHNYAVALIDAGQPAEAIPLLRQILTDNPDYLHAYHSLARAHERLGDRQAAASILGVLIEKAISRRDDEQIRLGISEIMALDCEPANLIVIANQLRISGRGPIIVPMLERFLARNPQHFEARMTRVCAELSVVYESEEEIARSRANYVKLLGEMHDEFMAMPAVRLAPFAASVATAKPFFLAYQGLADCDLQRQYGEMVSAIMKARFPENVPVPRWGARIRVGIASHYLWIHSVSKLFAGWVKHLDRSRFEVFVYQLGPQSDEMSRSIAADADHWVGGDKSDAEWREIIAADAPHVMIYPEIGMHTTAVRLAALRLAPVQCVTWGHPVTTGLPEMDYFLSSDLMEPEDGESHYTEELVRLPNLSVAYEAMPSEGNHFRRATLRVAEEDAVFICCQSLFKYLPRDDSAFVEIARRLPHARFVFIGDSNAPPTEVFLKRLHGAFAAAGLDGPAHVRMVQPVAFEMFPSFLRLGDAYLDSIGWSGGNTTLEALTCGLPVVTMPTSLMRGRHSTGILKRIGLEDYIADDLEGYVARAVRLVEAQENARVRAHIAQHVGRLFNDSEPVKALETFLEGAVKKALKEAPSHIGEPETRGMLAG